MWLHADEQRHLQQLRDHLGELLRGHDSHGEGFGLRPALTLVHFPGADPDLDRDLTRHLTSGFCGVQLTTAVAPDIKSGDHLPEAALRPLPKARDRASEISADVLALPGNRSVSGFTSLTLGRIGLAP